ncbi:MAG TPA: isochorismatase family protein [Xanthobacteraceae bacterium]|nr:isochorismatase family protein [Xanthobacteraceae bacterium]
MRMVRNLVLSGGVVLALAATAANAQNTMANAAAPKMIDLQMPALPDPVRVTLNPKTTALLVLDYVDPICISQAKCKNEMLPKAAALMQRARAAGVVVAYGTRERTMSKWLPEIAPMPGDIKITNTAQDRFYNTDLEKELKAKGVNTIIMIGWKASGSVALTSVGASLRDFTTVVPVDTTAAASDYETTIGFYNILNQGDANLTNMPLKPKSSTLSRSDLITFQ